MKVLEKDQDPSGVGSDYDLPADEKESSPAIAGQETRAVNIIRAITALVLCASAVIVSYAVYNYASETELETFRIQFEHQGGKVADEFVENAKSRLAVLRQFAQSVSLQAEKAQEEFPFVTIRNLEEQSHYVLDLAQVVGFAIHTVIYDEQQRQKWPEYVQQEQGWLARELAWQEAKQLVKDQARDDYNLEELQQVVDENNIVPEIGSFVPFIFTALPNGTVGIDPGPGPYAPFWQIAPALPIPGLFNYNPLSHPLQKELFMTPIEQRKAVLSPSSDESQPSHSARKTVLNLMLNRWKDGGNDYDEGPISNLLIPITNRLAKNSTRSVGAILLGYVYWQVYFVGILPEGTVGVIVVLKNTCDQAFTYQIDGPTVSYLGDGDLHDPSFDELAINTKWADLLGGTVEDTAAACNYRISVYPSETFKEEFITDGPLLFAIILSAVFVFTSVVFLTYDCLVQRRHRVINDSAVKTNAVVKSLFPDKVRDRLDNVYADDRGQEMSRRFSLDTIEDARDSDPIADLYPHCTVLFTDIAGFTKWSSSRSPTDVFRLLETLYGVFDKLAHKHKVFKVETIGDCYVAVTGLPQPQEKHAIIMCRFARDCSSKMHEILPSLCERLGQDTADLSMRFGLHSGPVTAGVLRGEKARFQLFGDTVNTAARMESNGERGKIHVSQETADLIVAAGKTSWITKRPDKITAKGKGELQTYWVNPGVAYTASSSGMSIEELAIDEEEEDPALDGRLYHRKAQEVLEDLRAEF